MSSIRSPTVSEAHVMGYNIVDIFLMKFAL